MIIGIAGPAYAGKSTVASIIRDNLIVPAVVRPLAAHMKELARTLFGWDGCKDEKGRKFLELVGDLGRTYDEAKWLDHWENDVRGLLAHLDVAIDSPRLAVIMDDMRLPIEYERVKAMGEKNIVLRLVAGEEVRKARAEKRGEVLIDSGHKTRDSYLELDYDHLVVNDGDLCITITQVRDILEQHGLPVHRG